MLKSYRESMNDLRFTREEKNSMVDGLMAAMESPKPKHKVLPLRRMVAVGAAAALVLALGVGAAATGVLKSAGEAFAGVFGGAPAQTEIIDRIGYPVGASDTVDGITITADAILGDTYSYAIVYTIARTDGEPLAEGIAPNELGYLPMTFDQADSDVGHMGGMHGTAWFFDEDPADNAVQFVQLLTADAPLEPGTATVHLTDLKQGIGEDAALLAEGSWELRFDFAFEDSSLELPGGQSFTVNGASAVLNSVAVSPLSLRIDYTVETGLSSSSGTADSAPTPQPVFLTLTDGSRIDLTGFGGGVRPEGDSLRCELSGVFDQILPLDTIESITIGEVTLPVNSQ